MSGLAGKSSGYIENLPDYVQRRLAALEVNQTECGQVARDFEREVAALERKYETIYAPLYKKVYFLKRFISFLFLAS